MANSFNGFLGIVLTLSICALILFSVVFFLDEFLKRQKVKMRNEKYPEIKAFEEYCIELKKKIQAESSWHYLKIILPEIENIYSRYHGKIPDDVLKSELTDVRRQYAFRRSELAPKIIVE